MKYSLGVWLMGVLVIGSSVSTAQQTKNPGQPQVPQVAVTAEKLIPRGWKLLEKAEGDLNKDNRPDVALVLGNPKEADGPAAAPDEGDLPRLLVVAFRDEQGKLHPSVVSENPILCHTCGGVFGDPFSGISIERGALVVSHYGGSAWRWGMTDRYRFQAGQWVHIGSTNESFHTGDPEKIDSLDVNLSTGYAVRKKQIEAPFLDYGFFQLRVGCVATPPAVNGTIDASEWSGPTIRLEVKEDIITGRPSWQGAADLSALFSGVACKDKLYVRAEITDNQVTPEDTVQLVTKKGTVLTPIETKTLPTPTGYVVESAYSLKACGVKIKDSIRELVPETIQGETAAATILKLNLTLEVTDVDSNPKATKVLSTSRAGRRFPACLLIVPHPGPELLTETGVGQTEIEVEEESTRRK